ncbi:protein KNATM-like [Hibiscus syriacus]|uniref:protein KNATM-like n=1 Tax=Hibiscus syriacus TaxID=106335 RepID=UPI0019217DA8|nr:protein KNATM-like [Hibiscus syriacus]
MEANKSEYPHQVEEAGDSDDIELLKTRISSHPLYGRLVQNHLNCLKEGYSWALTKLKEAMEEPQPETIAFINGMHSQLRDVAGASLLP